MMRVYLPVAFLFATVGLQASIITFTATSPTDCGQPCSGSAVFDIIDANDFTITLNNTLSSIRAAGQLVTDVEFTLAASSVTMTGSNGTLVAIDANGVPTVGSTGSTGWGFGSNNGVANNWLLCVICGNGVTATAQPKQGIIDIEALYASANGSIAGNPAHNPFLESGATFSFTTSATLPTDGTVNPFSNVFLSFGTTFGNNVAAGGGGTITGVVPEPVSLLLAGGGLIGVAMLKRRRRQ